MDDAEKILVCDEHYGLGLMQTSTLHEIGVSSRWIDLGGFYTDSRILPDSKFYGGYHRALDDNEKKVRTYIIHLLNRKANGIKNRILGTLEGINIRSQGKSDLLNKAKRKISRTLRDTIVKVSWPNFAGKTWTLEKNRTLQKHFSKSMIRGAFAEYDTYWTCFPPSLAQLFFCLAEKYGKRVVLNLGHRFNIGLMSRKQSKAMVALLKTLHDHPHHVLVACAEYECKYTEYYLGFRPKKLPLTCPYIGLKMPSPDLDTILLGPARYKNHTDDRHNDRDRIEERLNATARRWCHKHTRTDMKFAFIGTLYKEYAYADLTRHPAVVLFPYNPYSISMIELYELNIPFFVPSPDLLLQYGILKDRALYPVYCNKLQYHWSLSLPNQSDIPFSPNSYEEEAQRYWLQYCYFYQVQNAVIWHSEEDLMEKLHTVDLHELRRKMYEENTATRAAALQEYKNIVRL